MFVYAYMQYSTHRLLTVAEAGEALRLGRTGIAGLIRRGDLAAVRLGTGPKARLRIPATEVARMLAPVDAPERDAA
jgi:excisionase family DNA binding protein